MKKRTLGLLTAMITVGALTGVQVNSFAQETDSVVLGQAGSLGVVNTSLSDASETGMNYGSIADIAENNLPAIVAITNKSVQEVRDFFRQNAYEQESESRGSGIIVGENDTELLICTNNHVVEGAKELTVSFIDENSYEAMIKGTDPSNDLAVIAVKLEDIDKDTLDQIKIAQIGSSDDLRIGEQVVAIGNALGYGQSVTTGIISAKDRSIDVFDSYDANTYTDLIQTDAAINPGNSGGALLNMKGELIGINSAKASSAGVEGMGYAIPIAKAQPILEKLMNRETRSKSEDGKAAYLGITGQGVSAEVVEMYNVPAGIYVASVSEEGPAYEAGLVEGDIITEFDDVEIRSMDELIDLLQYYEADEEVELTVQTAKDGAYTEETLTITLGEKPDNM